MDVKNKNVFLSGPMSGKESLNVGAFAEAHHMLKEMGAGRVFDPAIEYLLDEGPAGTHETYMRDCIHELTTSVDGDNFYDLLVQLPGWELSDGAVMEYDVARACGITCVRLEDLR